MPPAAPHPAGVILSEATVCFESKLPAWLPRSGRRDDSYFSGCRRGRARPFRNMPKQPRSHRDLTSLGPGSCFLGPLVFTGGDPRPAHVLTATLSSCQALGWLVPSPAHPPVLPEPRDRAVSSGQHPVERARDRLPGCPACPPLVLGTRDCPNLSLYISKRRVSQGRGHSGGRYQCPRVTSAQSYQPIITTTMTTA